VSQACALVRSSGQIDRQPSTSICAPMANCEPALRRYWPCQEVKNE
jgi:hypothetical protein